MEHITRKLVDVASARFRASGQEVLGHIKKENDYTEEKMEHLKGLREDLYKVAFVFLYFFSLLRILKGGALPGVADRTRKSASRVCAPERVLLLEVDVVDVRCCCCWWWRWWRGSGVALRSTFGIECCVFDAGVLVLGVAARGCLAS